MPQNIGQKLNYQLQLHPLFLRFVHPSIPNKRVTSVCFGHVSFWFVPFFPQAMEEVQKAGLARNIGLSNFNQRQIQRILDNCQIKPANLQVRWSLPWRTKCNLLSSACFCLVFSWVLDREPHLSAAAGTGKVLQGQWNHGDGVLAARIERNREVVEVSIIIFLISFKFFF